MPHNNVIDKKRLVAACQAGDREAQGRLYTTYRRKMMKIIRQYVADYDVVQDIMHDGFLIILSQIQSLRNPESLDYWMATIMKNLAIHTLSQIKFDDILQEPETEEDDDNDGDLLPDELMALVNQLPNGYQTVFRLAVLEGKSHKEIADMLGISPKSSASQLARAKEKLRQLIAEHRKKAGLLAMLLLVVGSVLVYFADNEMNDDKSSDAIVCNGNQQQTAIFASSDKPNIKDLSETKLSDRQPLVATDTMLIADKGKMTDMTTSEPNDSAQKHDDTNMTVTHEEAVKQQLIAEEGVELGSGRRNSKWSVNFSTNAVGIGSIGKRTGGNGGNGMMADPDHDGSQSGSPTEVATSVHHLMPVTFGVRVSKELSQKWAVETGVQYSLLRSEITKTTGDWSYTQHIRAHYISIPVVAKFNFKQWKNANLHVLGGMSVDIPVDASIGSGNRVNSTKLHYPVSLSFDAGIGFEYHVSPAASLFIQPSLNYHIMGKSEYPILWQDKPVSFDLPVGIRVSW